MRPILASSGADPSFYEAAAQPSLWTATLEKPRDVVGSDGSYLIAFPASNVGALWWAGLDELATPFSKRAGTLAMSGWRADIRCATPGRS